MSYEKTEFGPGSIGALRSGGALSYGPTIGSNDATSLQGRSGSRGAYGIPGMSGEEVPDPPCAEPWYWGGQKPFPYTHMQKCLSKECLRKYLAGIIILHNKGCVEATVIPAEYDNPGGKKLCCPKPIQQSELEAEILAGGGSASEGRKRPRRTGSMTGLGTGDAQKIAGAGGSTNVIDDKSSLFTPAAQETVVQPLQQQQQQDQQQTLAPPVEEPLPPWVWVVGGLGVLGLVGGIVWYVTKKPSRNPISRGSVPDDAPTIVQGIFKAMVKSAEKNNINPDRVTVDHDGDTWFVGESRARMIALRPIWQGSLIDSSGEKRTLSSKEVLDIAKNLYEGVVIRYAL